MKKEVTQAVIDANRKNSKKSTGPRSERGKSASSANSLRHGILARKVIPGMDEEREDYQKVRESWEKHFKPYGRLERFLVEEVTMISWKLGITESREVNELLQSEFTPGGFYFPSKLKLPVRHNGLLFDRAWECERLLVSAVAGDDSADGTGSRGPGVVQQKVVEGLQCSVDKRHHEGSHVEVRAVLGNALSTMTRYRAALKREFYRAIETLRSVQAERRKKESQERHRS